MSFKCEFCGNVLKLKRNLIQHQKKAKKCKAIQVQLEQRNEIELQQEQFELEKQRTRSELEKENKELQLRCEQQKLKIKELEDKLFEIAKQPKTVNNTSNNTTINNTYVFQLSDTTQAQWLEWFSEHIPMMTLGGPEATGSVVGKIIKDQQIAYELSDVSRMKCKYKADGNWKADYGCENLIRTITTPVCNLTRIHYEMLPSDYQDFARKNFFENQRLTTEPRKFIRGLSKEMSVDSAQN